MLYHYLASDKGGKVTEGEIEVDSLNQVLQFLAGKELRPISVKPLKESKTTFRGFFGGISLTDKVFLTKYLALMLSVGTDLLSAIDILIADFDKPAVRNFLLEARENLSKGLPFYRAFEAHRGDFTPTFVSLIKAAETSGNLQKTFEELSESLSEEADLKSQIRSALIYPIVLLTASFAILVFLITFALPKVAKVFLESDVAPPLFSRIVFGVGLFLGDHIFLIGGTFLAILILAIYSYYQTEIGRRIFGAFLSHLPVVSGIYRDLALQRMSSTMSSLMKAGLPILQTIEVTAGTVGLPEFRYALKRIANEGLARGLTIGEAFKREAAFPRVVTNLIVISEKAGHLEEVLTTLASFYRAGISGRIKSLMALLEPLLLFAMGALIALIALSIIVPIYQLTTRF